MINFSNDTQSTNSSPLASPLDLSKSFARQLNFDEESPANSSSSSPLLAALTLKSKKSLGFKQGLPKSSLRVFDFDKNIVISEDAPSDLKGSSSSNFLCKRKQDSDLQEASIGDNQNFMKSRVEVKILQDILKRAISAPYEGTKFHNEIISQKDSNHVLSLPISKNVRDPDLNTISSQTLASFLRGTQPSNYLIIDCRYAYEYKGGHIIGALNIESPHILEKIFFTYKHLLCNIEYIQDLKNDLQSTLSKIESYQHKANQKIDQLPLIIFHCEFSQKRGPRAFRALRARDRELNETNWPKLDFPEIYVLEGGYNTFHPQFPDLCEEGYVTMIDEKFSKEYAEARVKEKQFWGKKYLLL